MHTDELRAELTELANEVAPFEGNVGAVHRRVAQRRIMIGSIAAVVVIALVVAAVAAGGPGKRHVHVAGDPKDRQATNLPRIDAAVVLPVGATADDVAHIRSVLDGTDAVEHYAAAPVGSFALALVAGANLTDSDICAARTIRGFAVELGSSPTALQELTTSVGSDAQVTPKDSDPDIEIFMQVAATNAQTVAVRDALSEDADVAKVGFVDHQDAYNQFAKLFADEPVLIENESPASLPESFDVKVRDRATLAAVAKRYENLPGVEQVHTSQGLLAGLLEAPTITPGAITRGEIELFMRVKATEPQIAAVHAQLDADPRVQSYKFLSHEDAFNEFRRLFSDRPELIKGETPEGLPTSFRVTLADPGNAPEFDEQYRALEGVDTIADPASGPAATCVHEP